jgi:uncharacterized phage protein (TIGR01671 family)
MPNGFIRHFKSGKELPCMVRDDNHDICFYTGLKDKNGKEIYEGDILNIHSLKGIVKDYVVEICWSEKELSFAFKENSGAWKRPTESMWAWIINRELEVIGNIYENTELLN